MALTKSLIEQIKKLGQPSSDVVFEQFATKISSIKEQNRYGLLQELYFMACEDRKYTQEQVSAEALKYSEYLKKQK
jgi:hypothetical protein